jgi:coenzyme PQQ synthesis protein D (PqqD)
MQCYRANTEKVVWRIVDGEAVIVHADTSAYYGLNATATCIWETLASASVTREDIGRRLSVRYGAAADALFADIDAFLAAAGKEELVVEAPLSNGNSTDEPRTSETPRPEGRYEPPSLSRFGELEKLVLSGE